MNQEKFTIRSFKFSRILLTNYYYYYYYLYYYHINVRFPTKQCTSPTMTHNCSSIEQYFNSSSLSNISIVIINFSLKMFQKLNRKKAGLRLSDCSVVAVEEPLYNILYVS